MKIKSEQLSFSAILSINESLLYIQLLYMDVTTKRISSHELHSLVCSFIRGYGNKVPHKYHNIFFIYGRYAYVQLRRPNNKEQNVVLTRHTNS